MNEAKRKRGAYLYDATRLIEGADDVEHMPFDPKLFHYKLTLK